MTIANFANFSTGLPIFQRVQAQLSATKRYIPANIDTLFQQHGNRRLIEDQAANARLSVNHPNCRAIAELIAQYNAGLEQEIVPQPTEANFSSAGAKHTDFKSARQAYAD